VANLVEETVPMKWMEWCAVYVIGLVTAAEIFITIGPYFGFKPIGDQSVLSQQGTIIQNVFISIVSFLIGASAGTRKKDDTIQTLSTTAATVATTANSLAPGTVTTTTTTNAPTTAAPSVVATVKTPDVEVPLHQDQTATVTADKSQENKT
jgi:hypothetical protein